jgi:hypothetical protein
MKSAVCALKVGELVLTPDNSLAGFDGDVVDAGALAVAVLPELAEGVTAETTPALAGEVRPTKEAKAMIEPTANTMPPRTANQRRPVRGRSDSRAST